MKRKISSTKTTIIMTLALSAIMFIGCSPESPLNEPNQLTQNQQDLTTKGTFNLTIQFEGFGTMTRTKPGPNNLCENLTKIESTGNTNEFGLGGFTTEVKICTDNGTIHSLEGKHLFENKDELYFRSEQWSVDKNGEIMMKYIYNGGTGYFEGATGTVKVYENRDWYSNFKGNYINNGVGTITVNR